ncbi:MAG TPA: hypothetical protein VMR95_02220 [Candidatus Binatia bacterium]|nr:hypothetical protein [Candidatus Binatia bacterium]
MRSLRAAALSLLLLGSALAPLLLSSGVADAYGQVQSRSITMSSAVVSNASTTYTVSYNVATSGVVAGMVVDFCSNDPIVGDTCTAPTGFSTGASPTFSTTPSTPGQTGLTWAAAEANTDRTLELTTSGSVSGSVSSGSTISFAVNTFTNPSTLGTFYARIFTFATTGGPAAWVTAAANGSSITGVIDAGGFALSTAQTITVTAKVQEQLTFCVGTTASVPSSGGTPTAQTLCSNLSGTTVTLGNTNGVLSSAGPYVDLSTQYIIGTNAAHAAVIVLKGATLTSGSSTITAIGSTATTSSAGTSQFGLCTYVGTGSNLVFTNETNNSYNSAACNTTTQTATYGSTGGNGTAAFGFYTTNTTSASGDILAQENAGGNSTGIIGMIANIPTTQTAGIYTTTLSFIATGTY